MQPATLAEGIARGGGDVWLCRLRLLSCIIHVIHPPGVALMCGPCEPSACGTGSCWQTCHASALTWATTPRVQPATSRLPPSPTELIALSAPRRRPTRSLCLVRQWWPSRGGAALTYSPTRCQSAALRERPPTLPCTCAQPRSRTHMALRGGRCMVGFTDKDRKHGEAALSGVRRSAARIAMNWPTSLVVAARRSPPT